MRKIIGKEGKIIELICSMGSEFKKTIKEHNREFRKVKLSYKISEGMFYILCRNWVNGECESFSIMFF